MHILSSLLLTSLTLSAHVAEAFHYYAVAGYDSSGGQLSKIEGFTLSDLMKYCKSMGPNCVGFSTDGVLKKSFKPRSAWVKVNDPGFKTFVRSDITIPPDSFDGVYERYIGWFVPKNDLEYKFATPANLKEDCDDRRRCTGFNSNGWLKSALPPQRQWQFDNDLDISFFLKGTYKQARARELLKQKKRKGSRRGK
jgi:hypothetical protein